MRVRTRRGIHIRILYMYVPIRIYTYTYIYTYYIHIYIYIRTVHVTDTNTNIQTYAYIQRIHGPIQKCPRNCSSHGSGSSGTPCKHQSLRPSQRSQASPTAGAAADSRPEWGSQHSCFFWSLMRFAARTLPYLGNAGMDNCHEISSFAEA